VSSIELDNPVDLRAHAAGLAQSWSSQEFARVGNAMLKVTRMDGRAHPEEVHPYDEGLLVLEGSLRLIVDATPIDIESGCFYRVAAGIPHAIASGSHGTLLIFDIQI
jgi:mannose-6-phosphate isomerase-like protein (cupin superfamily)